MMKKERSIHSDGLIALVLSAGQVIPNTEYGSLTTGHTKMNSGNVVIVAIFGGLTVLMHKNEGGI